MKPETAEKVSKLIEEKAKLYKDLASLSNPKNRFSLSYTYSMSMHDWTLDTLSEDLIKEFKARAETHINNKLKDIDEEIRNISCD
ncbi:MAG: hypothetical protein PQJ49_01825 [Sphaerochaetaceae bacterium]|nr:hypothetical protein [Sphaerochaetaceae bacterium]